MRHIGYLRFSGCDVDSRGWSGCWMKTRCKEVFLQDFCWVMIGVLKWLGPQVLGVWMNSPLLPLSITTDPQWSVFTLPSLTLIPFCYHHNENLSSGLHNLSPGLLWEAIMLKNGPAIWTDTTKEDNDQLAQEKMLSVTGLQESEN